MNWSGRCFGTLVLLAFALQAADTESSTAAAAMAQSNELKRVIAGDPSYATYQRFREALSSADPPDASTLDRLVAAQYATFKQEAAISCDARSTASQVHLQFMAAANAEGRAPRSLYLDDMAECYGELEKRGLALASESKHMYSAYVHQRKFDAAREFLSTHSAVALTPLPPFANGPSAPASVIRVIHKDAITLQREPVDLLHGSQLVVISSPSCHFTQDAIKAIEARPQLAAHLKDAVWLVPATELLDYDSIAEWNRVHPQAQMRVAYSESEFDQLSMADTPVFYFLREGKVVSKIVGWPPQDSTVASALEQLEHMH
ncbi:MAG: hypothetical protein ACJ8MR_04940 [Povalibacter sp.]